jgi:hypothetical protein
MNGPFIAKFAMNGPFINFGQVVAGGHRVAWPPLDKA